MARELKPPLIICKHLQADVHNDFLWDTIALLMSMGVHFRKAVVSDLRLTPLYKLNNFIVQ